MGDLKKFCALALSTAILTGGVVPSVSHAETPDVTVDNPDILSESVSRGINFPSKIWNVKTLGKYPISGSTSDGYNTTLYTDYLFTGYAEYYCSVKNTGKSTITVTVRNDTTGKTIKTVSLASGKSETFSVSAKSTDKIYLSFYGKNYSVSGSIS